MSASRRQKRRTEIGDNFITYKRSMMESPAFRVLGYSELRAMQRIEIEHMSHGGAENGRLQVTFDQFVEWGIDRKAIAPALRILSLLGFLEITTPGHAGAAGEGKANRFRLTYVNCKTREQPTDEWRRVDTIDIAKAIVSRAKCEKDKRAVDLGKRSWERRLEKISVPKAEPTQFRKRNQNEILSVPKTELLGSVPKMELLSIISEEHGKDTRTQGAG
jgi:hypothetical protein